MYRFWRHHRRFNLKLIVLILFGLSFTGGLALARQIAAPADKIAPPAGKQALSVEKSDYQGEDRVTPLLREALLAGGARPETERLEAWGSLNTTFMAGEALSCLARQLIGELGLEGAAPLNARDEAGFHALSWQGEVTAGTVLSFSLQSLAGDAAPGEGETYLLIDLEQHIPAAGGDMAAWRQQIQQVFRARRVEPHLTCSFVGIIPGRLNAAERRQRAEAVLAALEAREVEGVEETDFLSISAYSPRLPRHLEVAGRPVNTNVALRYHVTDDSTYLYLGYPLLGGEY